MRLFQASSLVKQLQREEVVFCDVVMNWFRVGQRKPPVPYHELIADHAGLPDLRRMYAEHFIDELFTATDVELLEKYLRQAHADTLELDATAHEVLTVREVALPVKDAVMGYSDLPKDGLADGYLLAEQPGYTLPFRVQGYFDLRKDGYPYKLDQSVAYLHRALQILGIDKGIPKKKIEAAAAELYRRNRLFVDQETTYKDWLGKIGIETT
jgi:hypothetical protein